MGRVLLIIGAVVGGLVFAFGVLGLILAITQPDAQQSDEIVGSIFFMVVGALVAAPCTFFAFRFGRRSAPWQPVPLEIRLQPPPPKAPASQHAWRLRGFCLRRQMAPRSGCFPASGPRRLGCWSLRSGYWSRFGARTALQGCRWCGSSLGSSAEPSRPVGWEPCS